MNAHAKSIGMLNSRFSNPSGASDVSYSTPYDMFILQTSFNTYDHLRSDCMTPFAVINGKEIQNKALQEALLYFHESISLKTGSWRSINKALCITVDHDPFCIMSKEVDVFNNIFQVTKNIINASYIPSELTGYYGIVSGREYKFNEHKRFIPASTTKLLTAICAFSICDPEQPITIKKSDIQSGSGTRYDIGETFSLSEAVKIMLMESSNTLANAIARTCGRCLMSFSR